MKQIIAGILRRWGSPVTAVAGTEQTELRAVLEPIDSVRVSAMRRLIRDAGEIPQGQYLYLGPPEFDPTQTDYLLRDGELFLPRRCERFYAGGQALFCWALLLRAKEEPVWAN